MAYMFQVHCSWSQLVINNLRFKIVWIQCNSTLYGLCEYKAPSCDTFLSLFQVDYDGCNLQNQGEECDYDNLKSKGDMTPNGMITIGRCIGSDCSVDGDAYNYDGFYWFKPTYIKISMIIKRKCIAQTLGWNTVPFVFFSKIKVLWKHLLNPQQPFYKQCHFYGFFFI